MANAYVGQRMMSEHVTSLMRRINALESTATSSGITGIAFDSKFGTAGGDPDDFGVMLRGVHIYGGEAYCSNNIYVSVWSTAGVYSRRVGYSYNPYSVFAYGGEIYVAGVNYAGDTAICVYKTDFTPVRSFGTSPKKYLDMFVYDGVIYVTTSSIPNTGIDMYSTAGTYIGHYGTNGYGDGEFVVPEGICVIDDYIYVADHSRSDVQKLDLDGNFVSSFVSTFSPGHTPSHICESPGGNLLISHYAAGGGGTIAERTTDGALIYSYSAKGTGDGEFTYLKGIHHDGTKIYATDDDLASTRRIQVFSFTSGTPISQTEFMAYRGTEALSLGTPDAGVSVPPLNGLYNTGFTPTGTGYTGAGSIAQHIIDMRNAIEILATSGSFTNPSTSNPYNWSPSSADNLYYVAMGDRTKYGATGGARYDWTRAPAALLTSAPMDIDIGEIAECVTKLEAA